MGLDMHLSLQEPDPFLTAIQPQVCCWEGSGSGFAVGHCARWWWCGWLWESPTCASSQPSWHTSARSPTLLILCLFVLFFTIIIIFPRIEEVPGLKRGTSLRPGRPLLGSSGGVALSQSQAAADTCQKFSHQGLTCQWCWALPELVPSPLGCCRSLSLGLGWMSRKGTRWCGSLTGAYRASASQATGLLKHHSFSGSGCPVLAIWSLLVKCTHCSESREGKAWGMQSSNNVIEQKHVYFLVGQSRGDQGKAEPCMFLHFLKRKPYKRFFFGQSPHFRKRGGKPCSLVWKGDF